MRSRLLNALPSAAALPFTVLDSKVVLALSFSIDTLQVIVLSVKHILLQVLKFLEFSIPVMCFLNYLNLFCYFRGRETLFLDMFLLWSSYFAMNSLTQMEVGLDNKYRVQIVCATSSKGMFGIAGKLSKACTFLFSGTYQTYHKCLGLPPNKKIKIFQQQRILSSK